MTLFDLVLGFLIGSFVFEYLIRIPINWLLLRRARQKYNVAIQKYLDDVSDSYYNSDDYHKTKKQDLH